ncbi:hypothetical protein BC939DRAFT_464150 [Gamsiella multidivaricata]|uniref:uncharacterized protein n=1 Tax=Gamsiella multidivaricata TaxID=101098 RepID=UPI00221F0FBA|nr:uncharacterized protein BC939DRAFT_464150 [Gamsiella multidivaricata]KAI7818044.1 hypothetical protein BC939DRAFT_464150 [Gamsiella multidivaricata]
MSYYNTNSTSPRQGHSAAYAPSTTYAPTKPHYTNSPSSANAYVAHAPTYIDSPFDDEPVPPANSHEKSPYDNPYNPDYMPSSYKSNTNSATLNNNYTQEHALSPSFSEKKLGSPDAIGGQTYAMQHLPSNNQNSHNSYNRDSYSNQQYYNGYDEDRPSLSNDTAPMRPHKDMETSEGLTRSKSGVTRVRYGKEKSKYLPCFPCIRSTCGRVTCCICLLLFLAIIALAVVVFVVFKVPKVEYLGMQGEPQFAFNQGNTTLGVNLVANIQVVNPNPIGFKFEAITATAYYPNYAPPIGGGNLTQVDFPSHSNKTIQFPIAASYQGSQDAGFTVVKDILSRCGVLGSAATQLTINYDLKLTIRILLISISPTIKNQHVNLACPPNIEDILNGVPGGLTSFLGGGKGA